MVDEIIGISGDVAEKSVKRRRPAFYSQQLVQQRIKVSLLRGHLNSLRLGLNRKEQLQRRMQRAGLQFEFPPTQQMTSKALREARDELQHTCNQSAEVRQAELSAKIDAASKFGTKSKVKILKAIRKVENNLKTFKILKQMRLRKIEAQSIDRLEIPASWPAPEAEMTSLEQLEDPKTCTRWKWVTDPQEVEHYLLLRNRLHFGQAQGTPFTLPPLQDDLDWPASTEVAEQILQGTQSYTSVIPNCEDLLRACQAATELDALPDEISTNEFRAKIKIWREATTTSPSGRHLGRYKALYAPGIPEDSDEPGEGISLKAKQEAIAALIVTLINYCIRNTYVLDRWKKIINVMIFKEQGNFKIHRLRVIHIYEADFNLILAVKWRQLLRHADTQTLLNEGQYGGRPGCEAQSLTLLEELKYDLSYLTRRTLVNFDNDATSCYDRIIVPFASLINRKYGLHSKIVAVHSDTLKQARFHLKTSTGVSSKFYSPSLQFPIHGTGQGSGNSPSIWLFISSTLFDVHNSLAQGATFISPDGKLSVRYSMIGFVDDSTGNCNDFQPHTEASLDDMLRMMAQDAQIWSNLLFCSGGKLELPKCSFHVLRFQFRPNGQPVPAIDKYDNRIRIQDLDTQEWINIPSKRPFDPHLTLGHFKSPTSKGTRELRNLKTKADRIALLISTSPITRPGAFLAYQSIYVPSIQYTLPQSFFSRHELDKAQASSVHTLLPKCGYNRNTARALIYAPIRYAGGGFLPWYMLQGEGQIKQFVKHWRTHTIVSRTLQIAVLWAQWQAGIDQPILEDIQSPIPYLECRWIKSLREFLRKIEGQIIVDIPIVPPPERQSDIYIMRYAMECGLFSDDDLKIINYCRLYLHVTTVSELFSVDGRTILPDLLQCRREPWFDCQTYITLQARPSEFQIRTKWQRLCREWIPGTRQAREPLELGHFTMQGHLLRRRRQTYFDHESRRVYHWQQDCYWEYTRGDCLVQAYRKQRPTRWVPTSTCTPIDTVHNTGGLLIIRSLPPAPRDSEEYPTILDFGEYVESLSPWEKHILQGIKLYVDPKDIFQDLQQYEHHERSLILVSDGSCRHSQTTYGWVLGSSAKVIYAEHAGVGYGESTSHRAEGWGMVSGTLFVSHLYKFLHLFDSTLLSNVPITFLSDNNGLVTRVQQRLQYSKCYPNATLIPDWDLVEQIYHTLSAFPQQKFSVQWVRGHQDETASDLSVEAHYNIRADELAGQVQPDQSTNTDSYPLLPVEKCRLVLNKASIQGHYTKAIREQYSLPAYFTYLEKRHGWTPNQRQQVDWTSFCRAASNSNSMHSPVQMMKLVHDKLPTNSERAKSDPHHSSKCTYCDQRETFHHLVTCPNTLSLQFRRDLQETVSDYLEHRGASEEFQKGFLFCLNQSLSAEPNSFTGDLTDRAEECVRAQLSLGVPLLLKGFLHESWRHLFETSNNEESQAQVLARGDSIAGVIALLWKAQFELWETHVKSVNQTQAETPTAQDKLLTYKAHIKYLHSKRDSCLPAHRDQYFHDDVDHFLSNATGTQMRQYIHSYEPAICASIKACATTPARSIYSFPGFRRLQRTVTPSPRPFSSQQPPTSRSIRISDENRGATNLRKHTRWKPTLPTMQSFRDFFHL